MSIMRNSGLVLIGIGLLLGTTTANAQHRKPKHHGSGNQFGIVYKFGTITSGNPHSRSSIGRRNSGNHVIRNGHGEVIGRYRRDTIPHNSTYIVPHIGKQRHGSYYVQKGSYYYYPKTMNIGDAHARQYQPQQIKFGGFSQTEDLSGRLESALNDLCLDLHYNYSENRGFKEIYREAYQVLEGAKFIHAADHQRDTHAIQHKLPLLDKLFHHVQDEVHDWKRNHHQRFGHLGISSKMDQIQVILHHLMNDTGVKHPKRTHGH